MASDSVFFIWEGPERVVEPVAVWSGAAGTHQHGLDGGHERSLHGEKLPGPGAVGRVLLVPQDPLDHVCQVPRGLEGVVGVGIHGVQAG